MSSDPLIAKFRHSVKAIGFGPTLLRTADYVRFLIESRDRRARTKRLLADGDLQERFTRIYATNQWGSGESVSGEGSTLAYTRNLRQALPPLFERFGIRRVFDAPCGDFSWMVHVVEQVDIEYIGADIVEPLIRQLVARHASPRVSFVQLDITSDRFPPADLWFCRDCLFHLSYADVRKALETFVVSGIPFLLTSTHKNPAGAFINTDILSGDFRRIDLFTEPFCFPRDTLTEIEDWIAPHPPRSMCLWRREQVEGALRVGLGNQPC